MIGNDIVDLNLARCSHRWQNYRFIEKIFSTKEQKLISKWIDPFQCIWRLWSMKESAYKSHLRSFGKTFFSPSKFECRLFSTTEGMITISDQQYRVTTVMEKEFIYSTAFSNKAKTTVSDYFRIKDTSYMSQHSKTYAGLILTFSNIYGMKASQLNVKKNELGIPCMYYQNHPLKIPISLTHHGHYCAYAIEPKTVIF